MKKAGMRFPNELVSQMTLDSLRRVGGGGWKRREEMASPMVVCILCVMVMGDVVVLLM